MESYKEQIHLIRDLCERALKGELRLETFYESWPEEANTNPFLQQTYEDVEDGVEHLPSAWLSGRVLSEEWHRSHTYCTIYLDYLLLSYDRSVDELMNCRKSVLEVKNLSKQIVENKVKDCFGLPSIGGDRG